MSKAQGTTLARHIIPASADFFSFSGEMFRGNGEILERRRGATRLPSPLFHSSASSWGYLPANYLVLVLARIASLLSLPFGARATRVCVLVGAPLCPSPFPTSLPSPEGCDLRGRSHVHPGRNDPDRPCGRGEGVGCSSDARISRETQRKGFEPRGGKRRGEAGVREPLWMHYWSQCSPGERYEAYMPTA
eukprot:scaffold348_cov329-Pavlova_lutheri.AAC.29